MCVHMCVFGVCVCYPSEVQNVLQHKADSGGGLPLFDDLLHLVEVLLHPGLRQGHQPIHYYSTQHITTGTPTNKLLQGHHPTNNYRDTTQHITTGTPPNTTLQGHRSNTSLQGHQPIHHYRDTTQQITTGTPPNTSLHGHLPTHHYTTQHITKGTEPNISQQGLHPTHHYRDTIQHMTTPPNTWLQGTPPKTHHYRDKTQHITKGTQPNTCLHHPTNYYTIQHITTQLSKQETMADKSLGKVPLIVVITEHVEIYDMSNGL